MNKLYDYVLERNISTILDGTFAYHNAFTNVQRSIEKRRKVEIFFLYQDPPVAWDFTKKREQLEKRLVSREVFIDSFFAAQKNVMDVKNYFQDTLELNLVIQNLATHEREFRLNIDNIDQYLVRKYTRDELEKILL